MNNTKTLKRLFLNSIKRGTGEAYLLAKNNPDVDFSNEIIKAALKNYAYDGQCEGDRAEYVFAIISRSKQKEKIRKAVLAGLVAEQEETWNLTHLFALTKLYAAQGDIEARAAIYDRFLNPPLGGADWVGYHEILDLGGFEGLCFIAEKFGRYLEQNPDAWQDDHIVSAFQQDNEGLDVWGALEERAASNQYIRIYLDEVKKTEEEAEAAKKAPEKYDDIVDKVISKHPFSMILQKRKFTPEEVDRIAQRLLTETDKIYLVRLLLIFDYHPFPYDSSVLLKLAGQNRSPKHNVVESAISALSLLKSDAIRAFAMDKILNSRDSIYYLKILTSNYREGDDVLLTDIARKTNNEHKIEQLAGIYTEIYKANSTPACREPLEVLYGKMNCAIHRKDVIEILIENKVLSDKIKEEMRYDCDEEIRALVV